MTVLDGVERAQGVGVGQGRVPVSQQRKVDATALAGSLLLLAVCAVLGALVFGRTGDTVQVYRAASDLPAGRVVEAGDLIVVEVSRDTPVSALGAKDNVIGQLVRADVPSGTLVNQAMFVGTEEAGSALGALSRVGLVLEPNQYPAGLSVGDAVRIIEIRGTEFERAGYGAVAEPYEARVVNTEISPGNTTRQWVTVTVDSERADRLAVMSSLQVVTLLSVGG